MRPANQRGSFTEATWNKPSRYVPPEYVRFPNQGNTNKLAQIMCYRCRQYGHYARDCMNDRYEEDSSPLCANCKQQGHLTKDCNAPFNYNTKDSRPQTNPSQEQVRQMQESPVHLVEIVQAVETRRQKRNADPILVQQPLNRESDPGMPKSVPTNEKEVRFTPKQILQKQNPSTIRSVMEERNQPILRQIPFRETEQEQRLSPTVIDQRVAVSEVPVQGFRMDPQRRRTEPVVEPNQVKIPVKGVEPRVKGSLCVASTTKPYDILKDLEELKPTI